MNLHDIKPTILDWYYAFDLGSGLGRFTQRYWRELSYGPDWWDRDTLRIALIDSNISVASGDTVTIMGREIVL